ncbi:hypothetical protein ILP97_15115 [Amycolatopsis sp. H6(2020)]|nr:hypothetical protein [Amycolatopsis sp. H6(2020)]
MTGSPDRWPATDLAAVAEAARAAAVTAGVSIEVTPAGPSRPKWPRCASARTA